MPILHRDIRSSFIVQTYDSPTATRQLRRPVVPTLQSVRDRLVDEQQYECRSSNITLREQLRKWQRGQLNQSAILVRTQPTLRIILLVIFTHEIGWLPIIPSQGF